jgi:hypothetical protein
METTITQQEELIRTSYRKHVLLEGRRPASVFKFCNDLGITEKEFYDSYASFDAIERAIWQQYITGTLGRLQQDANFGTFSIREKVLAFYFTLAEEFKADRSFVLHQLASWRPELSQPTFLKGFRSTFDDWFAMILLEGKQTGEIAPRPFLEQQYKSLFWMHFLFVVQFWKKDDSPQFEKTDMAIEKSVNLAFDLVGKGVLDGALDFGKFLYQQSKK